MIRYRQEGFKPRRDIKLALTCGEETPDVFNSVKWLLDTQPAVLDAEFASNEGAGGELDKNDKPVALQIQAGEKVYQDFALDASDVGGHSSRPTKNNPSCGYRRDRQARRLRLSRCARIRQRAATSRRNRNRGAGGGGDMRDGSTIRGTRRPSSACGR